MTEEEWIREGAGSELPMASVGLLPVFICVHYSEMVEAFRMGNPGQERRPGWRVWFFTDLIQVQTPAAPPSARRSWAPSQIPLECSTTAPAWPIISE